MSLSNIVLKDDSLVFRALFDIHRQEGTSERIHAQMSSCNIPSARREDDFGLEPA